jgi:putative ABC transport system permease protein
MLDLFFLAALNTLRNTRRSAITVMSIAIGCAALISFAAFIEFTFEGLRETTIRTQLGHMQVYAKGYWERRVSEPEAVLINDVEALESELRGIAHVSTVTPRLSFRE